MVISGVISRVTVLITHIRGLITYNSHEPPSSPTKEPGLCLEHGVAKHRGAGVLRSSPELLEDGGCLKKRA